MAKYRKKPVVIEAVRVPRGDRGATTFRDRALAATKDIRDLPLVEVTWVDACSVHSWRDLEEARKDALIECKTLGRLVRNDRRVVAVVQSIGDNARMCENWLIPRSCVRRIRVLR